ncbi:hypothetical protein [Biformimicrobium ophioploci]|uniref:Lipoprotein n=1 Tax=Biformimicrobium ophioploci TaxID=3036711 RepID=A0ABQ6LWQ0_9GAMM|nr:hypothetical protein [Microbulbifer sp. NKW57]GMG86534.1 hypothetical protein MNKW57_08550 [Microbulbifer sp. NKW57]
MLRIFSLSLIGALLAMLAGCSSTGSSATQNKLSAAGFNIKYANSSEKQAHLNALPQRQLVPHSRDGKMVYVFADAAGCNCAYVGTPSEYQQYRAIAQQEKVARMERDTARMQRDAALNWHRWGRIGRPYWHW